MSEGNHKIIISKEIVKEKGKEGRRQKTKRKEDECTHKGRNTCVIINGERSTYLN